VSENENEKITPEIVVEDLKRHFGEWVIKNCFHKGEPGLLVKVDTGQAFVVTVAEVKGVIVT
jgi:hypothetical protein